jgi:hypothetical protein
MVLGPHADSGLIGDELQFQEITHPEKAIVPARTVLAQPEMEKGRSPLV